MEQNINNETLKFIYLNFRFQWHCAFSQSLIYSLVSKLCPIEGYCKGDVLPMTLRSKPHHILTCITPEMKVYVAALSSCVTNMEQIKGKTLERSSVIWTFVWPFPLSGKPPKVFRDTVLGPGSCCSCCFPRNTNSYNDCSSLNNVLRIVVHALMWLHWLQTMEEILLVHICQWSEKRRPVSQTYRSIDAKATQTTAKATCVEHGIVLVKSWRRSINPTRDE